MPIEDKIKKVIAEKVDPILGEHLGGARLISFEDGVLMVKLTGACSSCPSAQLTAEDVVKGIIMDAVPEVKDVILDTSVSDDLIDVARKLMKH